MAGIDRGTPYDWLNDPEYKAQFEAAQAKATDMLKNEAIQRAYPGVENQSRWPATGKSSTNTAYPADIPAQGCPTTEITR